jgi:hypothetical protein
VTALINSGYLSADATVGRDGHTISTLSLISQTLSETCGAMSPAASWTREFWTLGDHSSLSDCLARSVCQHRVAPCSYYRKMLYSRTL